VVECDLAKVEVAGSTPVSRSIIFLAVAPRTGEGLCSQGRHRRALSSRARYPSGKGEVCKTFMRRFDSDPRLQNSIPYRHREKLAAAAKVSGSSDRGQRLLHVRDQIFS
jgi:hypothetical protein